MPPGFCIIREDDSMLKYKRISLIIVSIAFLFVFMSGSAHIFADNFYPLAAEETLVSDRIIDDDHAVIFTKLNENFYKKNLEKNKEKWIVTGSEIVYPRSTGLIIDEHIDGTDKELERAIDSRLNSFGLYSSALPSMLDHSATNLLPPTGDQGKDASCVGWSTGYYLRTYQQAKDIGWNVINEFGDGIPNHIFSPSFIYNQINNDSNNGASIEAAADLIKTIGAATIDRFPYRPGDYTSKPDSSTLQSAYEHRILDWKVLYSGNDPDAHIIQIIKEYLNTGDLVIAGNRVGFEFYEPMEVNGTTIITTDRYPLSNHSFVIVGYDDDLTTPEGKGAFKLINSWGSQWGDQGYAYITYEAFTANAKVGYVFTDLLNNENESLALEIRDQVRFNIGFSASGHFDLSIIDSNNELVYSSSNITCSAGKNAFVWDGRDMSGNPVNDGQYKITITAHRNGRSANPFTFAFSKAGKVESAHCKANIYNGSIQSVDIPIKFKKAGSLNIKVDYDNTVTSIIENQQVQAGETNTFTIPKNLFDFNGKDRDKIKIIIQIR